MTNFTGDIALFIDDNGLDIAIKGGQPQMTNGLNTAVLIGIFGVKDTPLNSLTTIRANKINKTFLSTIEGKNVSDKTRKDGISALKDSLKFLVDDKIASSIDVKGVIVNNYTIIWSIDILSPEGNYNYAINWQNQKIELEVR